MHIFEIVVPGTLLDYQGQTPRASWDMDDMLHSLNTQFFEANLALNLFEQSMNVPDQEPTLEQFDSRTARLREIEKLLEQERGPSTDFFNTDIRLEADARLKREEWEAGEMPRELENRISFVYAKAFLYALAGFARHLQKIKGIPGVPQGVPDIYKKMVDAFPDLREVRNSTEHKEDRVRSLGVNNTPLELQPITNGMVPPELRVLVLEELNGSTFRSTMVDGRLGEVDITPESMATLQGIYQEVLNAFTWKGPKRHLPSRKI